jgi:protein-tyrosine kinase
MEHIRQAVERARTHDIGEPTTQERAAIVQDNAQLPLGLGTGGAQSAARVVMLDGARLEDNRIIAHDIADPRARSFDMLRTQVLQTMDANSWQILGVTSPTAGCGKSVIATNLALSIARQRERSVLLVDMDLQKPQVARLLRLRCDHGLMSVLQGHTQLMSSIIQARVRNQQLLVLPCETSTMDSSEWMASRQMSALLQEIKRIFKSMIVIFDLPPVLFSDDVISMLPQIDCALFVTAAGLTTTSEIKECNKHLESTPIVRVVANKAVDAAKSYYYSYARHIRNQSGQKTSMFNSVTRFFDRLANVGHR